MLISAVRATFTTRSTELPQAPLPLAEAFANDEARQVQWRAFLRRSLIEDAPRFADAVALLRAFLQPVVDAIHDGDSKLDLGMWRAARGWSGHAAT